MNLEVNTPKGWETVENVVGFRLDEQQNLIIWRGDGADVQDVAFYRDGHWLSCVRQETG